MNIEEKMTRVATALSGLSRAVDAAIDAVRHDESFRNHPECREIEREICAILSLSDTERRLNTVWRRLSLLNAIPPCARCGRCGFIEDADMNLAGVCPECNGTGLALKSDCVAAGTADEKPDGQAENVEVSDRPS
jgi:predicted Zn-ribbon and HTH transcriptional regulator